MRRVVVWWFFFLPPFFPSLHSQDISLLTLVRRDGLWRMTSGSWFSLKKSTRLLNGGVCLRLNTMLNLQRQGMWRNKSTWLSKWTRPTNLTRGSSGGSELLIRVIQTLKQLWVPNTKRESERARMRRSHRFGGTFGVSPSLFVLFLNSLASGILHQGCSEPNSSSSCHAHCWMVASRRNSGKLWKAGHDGLYASPNLGALRSNVSRTQAGLDVCPVAGSRVSSRGKYAGKEEGSSLVFCLKLRPHPTPQKAEFYARAGGAELRRDVPAKAQQQQKTTTPTSQRARPAKLESLPPMERIPEGSSLIQEANGATVSLQNYNFWSTAAWCAIGVATALVLYRTYKSSSSSSRSSE